MTQTDASTWVTYWDELPEGQLLFRPEAEEYVRNLTSTFALSPSSRVLDFGCGYGFCAEHLAPRVGELFLWDAAPSMRQNASQRLTRFGNVHALDLDVPASTTLDFILVNSVVQYMTPDELAGWLSRWRELLAPHGQIVLSDLIPPGHGHFKDLFSLIKFSLRRGYLVRAVRNVFATRKRYVEAEKVRPLYRPAREELESMARQAGLSLRFLDHNLTHFKSRVTAVLREDVR